MRTHSPFSILRRARNGFTLVELLVVVAIIGVLATIAVPAYQNYALKARFTEVVAASAMAKAAVASCVATGACVSNGAISVAQANSGTSAYPSSLADAFPNALDGTANTVSTAVQEQAIQTFFNYACSADANLTWECSFHGSFYPNLEGVNGQSAQDATFATLVRAGYISATVFSFVTTDSSNAGTFTLSAAEASAAQASWAQIVAANTTEATAGMPMPCVGSSGCSAPTKYVQSMSVGSTGMITTIASTSNGLNGETFTLTPSFASSTGRVDWLASGTCKTRSKGALC